MNIVFRVDASAEIGTGHLMRCLALAERLRKEQDTKIMFISRDLQGNLSYVVQKRGFMVYRLPFRQSEVIKEGYARWLAVSQEIDVQETIEVVRLLGERPEWLIVDNYAIDIIWEQKIRPFVNHVFVIDDLADRVHDCDALLDQNLDIRFKNYYDGLVPADCRLFFGPSYALFREEFFQVKKLKEENVRVDFPKTVLVTFGGSDPTNETEKVLRVLTNIKRPDILVHVVVGEANLNRKAIWEICKEDVRFRYYCQIDFMARLLQTVDFVIGAPGTSLWEWCFLQVPSLVIAISDNQKQCADYRVDSDLCVYLGESENVSSEFLNDIFENVFLGKQKLNYIEKAYKRYFPYGSQMGQIVEFICEGE